MALDPAAVAAARSLARQVVNAGLAATEPVRQAYFAYVERGCQGMFGDLLVEQGLVSADALAELPDDGSSQHGTETGRFPRPTPSGRFSAAAKKKRSSSRLVPQSGLDLLADVDEADEPQQAAPALDARIPAGWDQLSAEKGLSILTELEESAPAPTARRKGPPPSTGPSPGIAKLKAPAPAKALSPVPSAGSLPDVGRPPPREQLDLALAPSDPEPEPVSSRSAPRADAPTKGKGLSFEDLALDLEEVKAKATRQVKRPQQPTVRSEPAAASPSQAPTPAQAPPPVNLEGSMDELSLSPGNLAAVEAAVASGRSLDELGFDLGMLSQAAAADPPAAADAKALEEAVASGRSIDELGFDLGGPTSPWGAQAPEAEGSPWGATEDAAQAEGSPWGASAVGAEPPPPQRAVTRPSPAPSATDEDDPLANLEVSTDSESNFFAPVAGAEAAPAAAAAGDEDDLQVGEHLGDYELINELGRGGMGIVFKALRKGSVHHYAIKTLKPGTGPVAQKRRRRFQREVEIMRQLDHNNLIRIYDCGRHGLYDWYSMDYVEGTELAQMLAEYRLSPDEKMQVFEDICKAMAHAHERGVVHRDLKPANVLIGDELTVRVLDFGLAKIEREEEDHNLTQAGTALGTPYYMSPEQILNPKDVGPEADVWSMGVMLYEMMTGRRPFVGQTAGEIANQILNHDPTPPKKINSFLHDDIEAICLRALDKDLGTRYATVEGMLADMQRHRRGKKVKRQSSRGLRRWLNQNKTPFLAGVGVASLLWGAALAYLQLML